MPVKGLSGIPADIRLESLPDPGNRFTIGTVIGNGVSGTVYEATDAQAGGKKVAVKIQKVVPDYENDIKEEYKILKYLTPHPNLPTFIGGFYKACGEVWFVLELCEGGTIIDLVKNLFAQNRHLSEDHIAFILHETLKALCHLHENHVVHRDVKASNILLTSNGEIKLTDFGLSKGMKNTLDKRSTCLGSPCWMAPELIVSGKSSLDGVNSYDNRIDVWALGITALELAEGQAPYENMHPTRAIFQIVRNPPPTFKLPSKWSQNFTDFVSECLVKIPEERPFSFEFLEHPFLKTIPDPKSLRSDLTTLRTKLTKSSTDTKPEIHLRNGRLQKKRSEATEAMIVEDLAAIDEVNEDKIMTVLQERFNRGLYYTYIGDILIFVNPNVIIDCYDFKYHVKYQWKSKSDNSPHIFAVADGAYQDMLHHNEPQNIILTGETLSGKTANYNHVLDHLLYLGKISNKISDKIAAASQIIQVLGNAATPYNNNSTRHVINAQVTFTSTGKLSGAIFFLYQLEKWRVTGYKDKQQGNFHIFYYFYHYMQSVGKLSQYNLQDKPYRYLNRKPTVSEHNTGGATNDPKENAAKYAALLHHLEILEFEEEQIEIVQKILVAIVLIGEISFNQVNEEECELTNVELANEVAVLLGVDERKFVWALCNYCVVKKGNATRVKHNVASASEAKSVFARGLYSRLVDFIVNIINLKLSVTRVVLGDKNYINVLDLPGFEVYEQNNLEQLFVNTTNEQIQHFYNQRIFSWELKEQEDEGILLKPMQFYDNKPTVDELLSKPDGMLYVIDEASRSNSGHSFIIEALINSPRGTRIRKATSTTFTVAHYSRKVEYNAQNFPKKNHDFLPPELIDTLRSSNNFVVKQLFANQFTKAGNLTISTDQNLTIFSGKRKKWGAALVSGDQKSRETYDLVEALTFINNCFQKFNTEAHGEYSQIHRMRTCAAVYRAASLEILRSLSEGGETGNVSFVRCIRGGLTTASGFEPDIVSSQLRAMSVLDTTHARQIGYSYRVPFVHFLDRYKFLAFDFDENVEITRENCRLLLIRLKMEGWIIGKNKVFLRYYDKEFLSRLYETQVKKIVKIQAVMRKFITKRKVLPRMQSQQSIGPGQIRNLKLVRTYAKKWRSKKKPTLYQVLLKHRARLFQDLLNFSQQVHIYNQHAVYLTTAYKGHENVNLEMIDETQTYETFIGEPVLMAFRVSFKPFLFEPEFSADPYSTDWKVFEKQEQWDEPLRKFETKRCPITGPQTANKDDEDDSVFEYGILDRKPSISPRYSGKHFKQNISLYSVEVEEDSSIMESSQYRKSFTTILMQLMCPSCCGGVFSEPKGSVYVKRPKTRAENASIVTELSEQTEGLAVAKIEPSNLQIIEEKCEEIQPEQKQIVDIKLITKESEERDGSTKARSQSLNENFSDVLSQELKDTLNDGEIIWSHKQRKWSYTPDERVLKHQGTQDTIFELKIRGINPIEVIKQKTEDEPPYNFQAMLRKTNSNRPSLRRNSKEHQQKIEKIENLSEIHCKIEIFPGAIMEGIVYEL